MNLQSALTPASWATAFVSVTIFLKSKGSLSHGLKQDACSSGDVEKSFASSSYAPNRTFHIYNNTRLVTNNVVRKGETVVDVLCEPLVLLLGARNSLLLLLPLEDDDVVLIKAFYSGAVGAKVA